MEYTLLRPATQVMAELCRLCTDSSNPTCVDRHCYPFLSCLCNKLELNLITESKNKNLVWFGLVAKNIENLDPQSSEIYCPFQRFFAFFGHLIFLMGMIKVSRCFGLEILILKHTRKSEIRPLEPILG